MGDIYIGWYFLAVCIVLAFYLIQTQKVELSYSTSVSVGNKGFAIGEPTPGTQSRLSVSDVNNSKYRVSYDENGKIQVDTEENTNDDVYEKAELEEYWKGAFDSVSFDKGTTPTKLANLEDNIRYGKYGANL